MLGPQLGVWAACTSCPVAWRAKTKVVAARSHVGCLTPRQCPAQQVHTGVGCRMGWEQHCSPAESNRLKIRVDRSRRLSEKRGLRGAFLPLPAVYEDARVISRRADSPSFLDTWKVLQKDSVTLIGPGFPCRGNTINVANCNCEALFTGFLVPVTLAYWSIRISDGVVPIGTRCSWS
eukprot:COSAG01_NODE_18357_length_1081_cov_55.352342_2_plen_177_part_00